MAHRGNVLCMQLYAIFTVILMMSQDWLSAVMHFKCHTVINICHYAMYVVHYLVWHYMHNCIVLHCQWHWTELGLGVWRLFHTGWIWYAAPGVCISFTHYWQPRLPREGKGLLVVHSCLVLYWVTDHSRFRITVSTDMCLLTPLLQCGLLTFSFDFSKAQMNTWYKQCVSTMTEVIQ